ncbi:MAG: HypC/HybG/HupF family hydrogenase formation chaperone [Planctomycetes bacterium]|nr:HypC/HybG/HupF family hydrogenase formation chaperone [Planctomycetota bacterium]
MCLGVPGQVVHWIERNGPLARAEVEFGGIRRVCHMSCVPDAETGDYVIVHAGIAISRVDAEAAGRALELVESLNDDEGWRSSPT